MPHRDHPLHRQWQARRRRLRRLLRHLPRRGNVARYPVIKWFAEAARKRPYLWSFKRAQVIPALYLGSVLALMPTYGLQIVLAFAAAVLVRGNLTVMVALQMITNPLTIGPVYYATYRLGAWLIGLTGYGEGASAFGTSVNALVLGGAVGGLLLAVAADVLWRVLAWEARRFKSQLRALHEKVVGHPLPAPEADEDAATAHPNAGARAEGAVVPTAARPGKESDDPGEGSNTGPEPPRDPTR